MWLDLAIQYPLEEVLGLLQHNTIESCQLFFAVAALGSGEEPVAFHLQPGGIDNHVAPCGSPVEVLSQPIDDRQTGSQHRRQDCEPNPQHLHILDKLRGRDRGDQCHCGTQDDRPGAVSFIEEFVAATRIPVVLDLALILLLYITLVNCLQLLEIRHAKPPCGYIPTRWDKSQGDYRAFL